MPIRLTSHHTHVFNKKLRTHIEKALLPIATKIKLSPNIISLLAFVAMAYSATLIIAHDLVWACFWILISGLLDLLDGAVARAQSNATALGAFLDRVIDRASDFVLLASIMIGAHVSTLLGLYVLFVVMLSSFISAYLEKATASDIGQKISLRGVRLILVAMGCLSNYVGLSMVLLAYIGTYSVFTRLHIAFKTLYSMR